MEKVEAIHLYQSTRKAGLVEQRLHQKLRTQHGNVHPHDLKSKDLYATERLQAILDWISCARSSSSQSTLLFRANDPTRKNKRERKWSDEKKAPGNFDLSSELKRSSLQDLSRHSAVARPSENIIWKKKVFHVLSKMLLSIIIVPTNVFLFL